MRHTFLPELLVCLSVSLCATLPVKAVSPTAELISVKKIWDQAPHNAFTDLVSWKNQFICGFREGKAHVSADGGIRILTSLDGETWKSAASLSLAGFDLRDAGLATTPDGRIMLVGGAAPRKKDKDRAPTGTFVSFSDDSKTWTDPQIVVEPGRWLWHVTWHDNKAYGIAYASVRPLNADLSTQLLVSTDGLEFTPLVEKLFRDGIPTEAKLQFAADGTMYCLQRRDGEPKPRSALFGTSRPPYSEWKWHDLETHIGGPNFIKLPSGQWLAAGRFYNGNTPKTKLAVLDVDMPSVTPILELPSGGDSSYPGLAWRDGKLWMSYYSSHEGRTSIYLAQIRVE